MNVGPPFPRFDLGARDARACLEIAHTAETRYINQDGTGHDAVLHGHDRVLGAAVGGIDGVLEDVPIEESVIVRDVAQRIEMRIRAAVEIDLDAVGNAIADFVMPVFEAARSENPDKLVWPAKGPWEKTAT